MTQNEVALNYVMSAVANAITTRSELLKRMGDPRRDIDTECGYTVEPSIAELNDMYKRNGIARRVVHIWPEESWQVCPSIWETEEPDDTTFEAAWKDLELEHNLFSVLAQADAISGIGRFGIVLLGLDDGLTLDKPVKKGKRKLLYARAFDESVTTIDSYESDIHSPRYGQPLSYTVAFNQEGVTSTKGLVGSQKIHWTRVIHLADLRRNSLILADSRMRAVYNNLEDVRKTLGGSAEMFWQGAFPGLSFEVDPQLAAQGNVEIDNESLKEQIDKYVNGLQRYLSTCGLSVKSLSPQVADPSHHLEQQMKTIALALGVPFRVFMGTEEAKLASNQDSKSWSKRVGFRQNMYLTPFVVRPMIKRLIDLEVLPKPEGIIHIEWPDMLTPSDQEKAEVAANKSKAAKDYCDGNVEALIPRKQYLMNIMGFTAREADVMIKTADDEENRMVPGPGGEPEPIPTPAGPSKKGGKVSSTAKPTAK